MGTKHSSGANAALYDAFMEHHLSAGEERSLLFNYIWLLKTAHFPPIPLNSALAPEQKMRHNGFSSVCPTQVWFTAFHGSFDPAKSGGC